MAVDGLSLKAPKGELFSFPGQNGAGKTTSIKMMAGLLRPTSGQVLIEGEDRSCFKADKEEDRGDICGT